MMFFVVPKLVEVFEGFNVELPFATRVLIFASDVFQNHWLLLFLGAFISLAGAWGLMQVKSVNAAVNNGMLYMPVVGGIIQKINLGRFSRNLSSLLQSGVSFIRALEILGENTPHPSYGRVFMAAREHVRQGKELSGFLADFQRLFPPIVINVIKVGEETGALDQVLGETALFYESEVDQTMKNLTSIMEPILMVGVGLAVGALAVSVIAPIYDLVNVV
jgi:type IV pilus assembly protein PilC